MPKYTRAYDDVRALDAKVAADLGRHPSLSILTRVLSIVGRRYCQLRGHRRGLRVPRDGRMIAAIGPRLYLRCRYCLMVTPGWILDTKHPHILCVDNDSTGVHDGPSAAF